MVKYYKIAGLNIQMDSFGRTVEQAKPYEISKPKQIDFEVVSWWDRLKPTSPGVSDDVGEYMCTAAVFYKNLMNFQGLMLHSSAVVVDNRAYLFTADSGTGKSTHTQLWLKKFGDQAYLLNDDKPALRRENGKWYAYGTPWSGKYDISVNKKVPVAGIATVCRAEQNSIAPYSGKEAIHDILAQIYRPKSMEFRIKMLELLDQLLTEVPIWKLNCNMEPEAADVSYAAMSAPYNTSK